MVHDYLTGYRIETINLTYYTNLLEIGNDLLRKYEKFKSVILHKHLNKLDSLITSRNEHKIYNYLKT